MARYRGGVSSVRRSSPWLMASLALLMAAIGVHAQVLFADDFNRPDGPVGNGWSTWHGTTSDSADTVIQSGQLRTLGAADLEGGIYRTLPITLPVTFSFQFRTDVPTDGGWDLKLNAAPVTSASQLDPDLAQIRFLHYRGSVDIAEYYANRSGGSGNANANAPAQRDFGPSGLATITGQVNADLSSVITIAYNDGLLPSTAVYSFAAPTDAAVQPTGTLFILSDSNASAGPHFFDNLVIRSTAPTAVPEPGSLAVVLLGSVVFAGIRSRRRRA